MKKTMLAFLAPNNQPVEELKNEIIRYFGSKGISDEMRGFPAIIVNNFDVSADQTYLNQFVGNTNIVVLIIENPTEDFISGFANKNFIWLKSYGEDS